MPAKELPDKDAFEIFSGYMQEHGFRKLSRAESSNSCARLGLQAPRPRQGRETGFIFNANGLTVWVWTTYLESQGQAREEDAGWVVITEGDRPVYYSHPMMRTEGFLRKLYRTAQVAKERVSNRPRCPSCHVYMHITKGKHLKQRYWSCSGSKFHWHRAQSLLWDYGLSDESIIFLNAERRARRRYSRKVAESGQVVIPAILRRKPWVVRNPQNAV